MSVKASHVVIGIVLAGGTVGLMVGTRGTRVTAEARHETLFERARNKHASAGDAGVGPALSWSQLPGARRGPNAEYTSHLQALAQTPPAAEVAAGRGARLAATLAARAERRAFDGAPPRVPHSMDERGTSACVACHLDGLVIGERVAPRMSHPLYQSCTQCHVAMDRPLLERAASPEANDFVGLAPAPGVRWLPGAPPVMPHTRWMHERCSSCHGALGPPGLRTTHPERQSCEQCHAPGPSLVQEVFTP